MTQVWVQLSSAVLSSGSPLPSAGGSAGTPSASVSAASAGPRRRWTEVELQLHFWRLRMDDNVNIKLLHRSEINPGCRQFFIYVTSSERHSNVSGLCTCLAVLR